MSRLFFWEYHSHRQIILNILWRLNFTSFTPKFKSLTFKHLKYLKCKPIRNTFVITCGTKAYPAKGEVRACKHDPINLLD